MTPTVPVLRVVLVGFMAAGKSTVGRQVARALGWDFHDLDDAVEAREGRSITSLFADAGEPYFREVEARIAEEYLGRDHVVLATGGGWAAQPGRLEGVPDGTLTVWLKVSAEESVRRAGASGKRPLLAGANPLEAATELLTQRASRYAAAAFEVDTEGRTTEDVAARIVARVRRPGPNHTT